LRWKKTKYLTCKFSEGEEESVPDITIFDTTMMKEVFKCLDAIIEGNGEIDDDIGIRVRVGWQKWRYAVEGLYDKKIQEKLKGKIYRMVV